MNAPIQTLSELKSEINRLSLQKKEQEIQISANIYQLTNQLRPINLLKSFLISLKQDKEVKNHFASMGTETAISFILSNVFFHKSNPLFKTIITLAGSSFISKLIGDDTLKYFDKLKTVISRIRSKIQESDDVDSSFNEKDIYKDD